MSKVVPTSDAEAEADDNEIEISLTDKTLQRVLEPRAQNALYAQYFAIGIVASGLPATLYGFFLNYMAVDSFVYATAAQVIGLPWSFKIFFGMINDCFPVRRYRRKPYMCVGWFICTCALVVLATRDMPAVGDASAAGTFSSWMALAAVGYIMADVAADGLTVELAKLEPDETRGTLQSNVYLVRALGSIVAALLVGLGMNGPNYNGSFSWSLDFTQVMAALSVPSAIMVPVSWWEHLRAEHSSTSSVRTYLQECHKMLSQKGMFYLCVYSLCHGVIGDGRRRRRATWQRYGRRAGDAVGSVWHRRRGHLCGGLAAGKDASAAQELALHHHRDDGAADGAGCRVLVSDYLRRHPQPVLFSGRDDHRDGAGSGSLHGDDAGGGRDCAGRPGGRDVRAADDAAQPWRSCCAGHQQHAVCHVPPEPV